MKIIFDTNILIHIEDPKELSQNLQELLKIFREHGHQVFIHPASFKDINNDEDIKRRNIIYSKLKGYPVIGSPPLPDDAFLSLIGLPSNSNDQNDNEILFSIKKDIADFLITEDRGIRKKSVLVDLDDRVFSIDSALDYFNNLYKRYIPTHTILKEYFVHNLDIEDPFFDSLKEEYGDSEFNWWIREKCIKRGRKCWTDYENNALKALLVLKEENEKIKTSPPIPAAKRLKIATLKVDMPGSKFGELFLKMAFQYCINNQIFETYLTHFPKEDDKLLYLIENFGFEMVGKLVKTGEEVFLKEFIPVQKDLAPIDLAKKYYPCFKDDPSIRKFLVPIKPDYHDTLFPDYTKNRQMTFSDYSKINVPGNAIRKAYLSYSKIKKIRVGDIILFYRSRDQHAITSLGIVDQYPIHTDDLELLKRVVGKRSVYSDDDLKEWIQKPVFVLLFKHHLNLPKPLNLDDLREHGIIQNAPQSIREINHTEYSAIKKRGQLDERFTVN